MITLAAADTLAAGASAATQVTSTVFGMELTFPGGVATEVYKVLDQRQLAAAPATIYTVAASTTAFIKTITVVNNDASARTAQYFRGGTAAANAITPAISIPAGGWAIWEDGKGWTSYDSSGNQLIATTYTNPFFGLTGVLRADAGVLGTDADVTDIVAAAADAVAGKIELAVQSEMEAATDVVRAVTPGRVQYHPGVAKAWGKAAGAGSLTSSHNITSVTDTGPGNLGVTIATDFSSADYAIVAGTTAVATTLTVATIDNGAIVYNASQAAGSFSLWNFDHTATTHVVQDPQSYFWACFGDQA